MVDTAAMRCLVTGAELVRIGLVGDFVMRTHYTSQRKPIEAIRGAIGEDEG